MVYDVNEEQISAKMGVQLLDFLSKLGFYKTEVNDDFECTTSMIDLIAENIKSEISNLTSFDKDAVFYRRDQTSLIKRQFPL